MKYSDIIKITDIEELRNFTEKLLNTTVALKEELQQTKDKLFHLEEITKHSSSIVTVGSNEEELCKLEINRLYTAAKSGPLEFNDVKAFEIYVKSLMLIRGKSNLEEPKKKKSDKASLTNDQLLQLALQVVDDTNEQ